MRVHLTRYFLVLIFFVGVVLIASCLHDRIASTIPIKFIIPQGFPSPTYSFNSNPLTEQGFLLGRKLFYDGRLSVDGNYPCASCHQPVAAFTTFEHDRSHGFNNHHTLRNAPALFNLAWNKVFNQDGSAPSLESIYIEHITEPTEMASSIAGVMGMIKADPTYNKMFLAAFGDHEITADRMFKALSQFVINLVSSNSKYDKVKSGQAVFADEEIQGYIVFQSKCSACHTEPLFTDFTFHNTGLPIDPTLNDYGRMRVTGNRADSIKFRTPSLRNLELTSNYGHDGRFTFPRDMIHHYEKNVQAGPTLDLGLSGGIPLTETEENNLIFFLRTLSDSSFINNPRFKE